MVKGRRTAGAQSRQGLRLALMVLLVVVPLGFCEDVDGESPEPPATSSTTWAPSEKFITYDESTTQVIAGSYMVMFVDGSVGDPPALARRLVKGTGGRIEHVFDGVFDGFAVTGLSDAWAAEVSRRPDVEMVRQDFWVTGFESRGSVADPVAWQLDWIDQRSSFRTDRDYRFKTGPVDPLSPEVPIYVLDNGINAQHHEFVGASGSRVQNVVDLTGTNFARCSLPGATDAGHGTSVASLAAGSQFGIHPAPVMNVKVLDRNGLGDSCKGGYSSRVIAGLHETYEHMVRTNVTRAVVNLSLGWTQSTPDLLREISALQARGAIIVAAAGNENVDASGTVPASLPGVIAVGATGPDRRWVDTAEQGSNFGPTISLWAPGDDVRAADWPASGSPQAETGDSGTSLSAPLVAGAAALLWRQNPQLDSGELRALLLSRATRNMLLDLGPGSDNALLFIGEDTPVAGVAHTRPRSDESISAGSVSSDGSRLYLAGSGSFPFGAIDTRNLAAGPLWVAPAPLAKDLACTDVEIPTDDEQTLPEAAAYFACTGPHPDGRRALVVATREDQSSVWSGPSLLPVGSAMNGITDAFSEDFGPRLYALTTEPAGSCHQPVVYMLSTASGAVLGRQPLEDSGFTEPCHQGVDLVVAETRGQNGTTQYDLVVTTYADPSGADSTFVWWLDPTTLGVEAWGELPAPAGADGSEGMFATAIAAQPLERRANVEQAGEVFVSTQYVADAPPGNPISGTVADVYRLDSTLVSGRAIDERRRMTITSLVADDGDVFYGGLASVSNGFGSDSRLYLAKSEGVTFQPRRWTMVAADADPLGVRGLVTIADGRIYVVSTGSTTLTVTQHITY
jgi:hypothetical protein